MFLDAGQPRRETTIIAAILLAFLGAVAASCPPCAAADAEGDVPVVAAIGDYRPHWKPVFRGIDLDQVRKSSPMPQAVYAVRITLKEPSVRFLVTPSNGPQPLDTNGRKTSAFLKEFRCQLAVNASPFSPVEETEGSPRDVLGLSVSKGVAYSKARGDHAALLITKHNKATITRPPFELKGVQNAVCGFFLLLEKGRNVGTDGERHPRTAAGVSQDGRFLYLLVIDGRQGDYSVGTTTAETAEWIQQLGAYDAVNLDGGGSTSLVIDDGHGGCKVVNRPIHANLPGTERVNGNHLGVFAEPLQAKPSKAAKR